MSTQEHFGKVTQKGQITIPLAVRRFLEIKPHDRIIFRLTKNRVELLPANMTLEGAYGAVKPMASPEDWKTIRRQVREERIRHQIAKSSG